MRSAPLPDGQYYQHDLVGMEVRTEEGMPLGTLAANLVGGYLIGIAVALFQDLPQLAPEWRLLLVTGFLGGLTTFSTFSAEAVVLLQRGAYGWALLHTAVHLLGSAAFCLAGLATWRYFYP